MAKALTSSSPRPAKKLSMKERCSGERMMQMKSMPQSPSWLDLQSSYADFPGARGVAARLAHAVASR